MADFTRVAGSASINIDGQAYAMVGEFAYRCSGTNRETLGGNDGIHGFKEMPVAGQIKGKLRDSGAISVQALSEASNVTVVLDLANGKTIVGRNMVRVGDPLTADADDGSIDGTWEGPDVVEL